MRKILSGLVVGLFLVTGSLAAASEGGKPKIANYGYGMNFMIPTGDKATAGFLMILSEKLLLELDLGFGWQDGEPEGTWGLVLGPAARYYIAGTGPVNLYLKGKLEFAKNKDQDADVALFGGLGVEWFVAKQFSIAGDTGLAIKLMPSDNLGFSTLTHGLSANIYW